MNDQTMTHAHTSTPRSTKKPVAWSHQNELKTLLNKMVTLLFPDDSWVHGKLLAADQFTIKLLVLGPVGHCEKIFFKSALAGFQKQTVAN